MACFPMRPLALLPAVDSLFAACAGEKSAPARTRKLVALRTRFAFASPGLHFSLSILALKKRYVELVYNPEDDSPPKNGFPWCPPDDDR